MWSQTLSENIGKIVELIKTKLLTLLARQNCSPGSTEQFLNRLRLRAHREYGASGYKHSQKRKENSQYLDRKKKNMKTAAFRCHGPSHEAESFMRLADRLEELP